MEEYIIKTGTESDWQKWLNQWRHNYNIEIVSALYDKLGLLTMIINRTAK